MTLRCLYRPGWDPPPAGNAVPTDDPDVLRKLPEADREALVAERTRLREAVAADTIKPLWGGPGDHEDLINERLRAMTIAERIEIELRLIERVESMHEYEYDPLKY